MNNQCCFICNNRAGLSLRNASSLFGEHNTLSSGRKVSEVVSEIVNKPVVENKVHTNILCKKCYKTCNEYDSIQVRLQAIKKEMLEQFKLSLPNHNLDYENYEKNVCNPPKLIPILGKKLVLPASKLQPIPPDLLLKVGKIASFSKPNLILPQIKPQTTASTVNLKVTVGSSVLTQTVKTTTSKPVEKPSLDSNSILNSLTNALKDDIDTLSSSNSLTQKNSILSFNVNSLPKDFLSGAVLTKIDDKDDDDDDKGDGNNDDHPMEIDEDCLSVVPVTTSEGGNLVLKVEGLQTKSSTPEVSEYLNVEIPTLDADTDVTDAQKYILGKLEILNEGDDDDEEGHTIVVDSENGEILRMVAGQKFIYEGGEISLVMPDDHQPEDGDQQDNGDSQDSNDESQIELQVSGDEETANAIIAAAQEQGGAFIKVESGEMFRVKSVSSTTSDGSDVDALQIVAQEGNMFKCLLCEKNASAGTVCAADSMMRHLKSCHGARLYLCRHCGAAMRRRTHYAQHIASHATEAPPPSGRAAAHRCGTCGKCYSSRTLLHEHNNVHSGAKPYACALCNKAFASKYTHQAHLKTHAVRPRPFKCNQCGKSFLTQQNLNQHEKTHSGIKDFVCNICNKAFSTQHNLEVHGVVHSGNKAFVCSVCGKAFARRAELRDHLRIHTGERPFSCDICGARFTQRSNLHSHRRATHFDDKRYHCDQCPKRFKRRRLLEYHIKATHTGERPLKCSLCQLSFVYPEHYKKHVRTHSGERPYVCEICGKSFNSRDNRNTHRFVHSDKKPYECVACGAGYMRKQLLYAHMNTSGHLAESIVVNQPRVIKVTENSTNPQTTDITNIESNTNKFDAIFETSELENSVKSVVKSETEVNLQDAKFFITDDKKLILQDSDKATLNLIQEGDESALFTIHNIGERSDGTILEAVDADQLGEQTEIVANDENGGMVRLIQIKLPDGNNGWVAINR
ncbi:zinc finger protein 12-like isoform X2 [Helicoverpa zea]|uniref:zinc finger protein 12-like isoform X2 n=1 Tax=Helicoverpa zea TaxID=7113 RepID=UPI001F564E58|nr:zinc finger protein 12-like isoform X2 [Helicoverpa zea]